MYINQNLMEDKHMNEFSARLPGIFIKFAPYIEEEEIYMSKKFGWNILKNVRIRRKVYILNGQPSYVFHILRFKLFNNYVCVRYPLDYGTAPLLRFTY